LTRLNVAKKIIGTDIAPVALEQARIRANSALHHIMNLDEVISNLYRSLKTGGYLIANVS